MGPWQPWQVGITFSLVVLGFEVRGVLDNDLERFLAWTASTLALRKALADSKFLGVNTELMPLPVGSSVHVPSIKDLEQYLTALTMSTHSEYASPS